MRTEGARLTRFSAPTRGAVRAHPTDLSHVFCICICICTGICIYFAHAVNSIGPAGAVALSKAHALNMTIQNVYLCSELRSPRVPLYNCVSVLTSLTTDNDIGSRGASAVAEAVEANTTITAVHASGALIVHI